MTTSPDPDGGSDVEALHVDASGADGDGPHRDGPHRDGPHRDGPDPGPDAAGGLPRARPDEAAWAAVPDPLFREVVAHARRALTQLDEVHVTPEVRRLRALPAPKLSRGRGRRRLVAVLAASSPVWLAVHQRVVADPDLAERLAGALSGGRPSADVPGATADGLAGGPGGDTVGAPTIDVVSLQARLDRVTRQRDDARTQLDRTRADRDDARAQRDRARDQRDGAVGREASLRARLEALDDEADQLRRDIADMAARLAAQDEAVQRAVERERRRGEAARTGLATQLTDARRALDHARREVASAARRERPGPPPEAPTPSSPSPRHQVHDDDAVVPGRPSRIPPGVRLDTREGAEALLTPGRLVLVDGYNVSRTHRSDLSLERQRAWLVDGLASLAARRRLDVQVVFDAHLDGRPGPTPRRRGVDVVFSHAGITADDELVFAVEAMDARTPVVVVTDDRGLRERLRPLGVDLLHTSVLSWLL